MKEKTKSSKDNLLINPTVVAAIIGAAALIITTLITVYSDKKSEPRIYSFTISPTKYPFEKTPVEVHRGDDVEILILNSNSTILDCGLGETTVTGMVSHPYQTGVVLPTANMCSVIGRIGFESAPPFFIGEYSHFVSNSSGVLFMGINDLVPEQCFLPILDCFADNTGEIFVQVSIY